MGKEALNWKVEGRRKKGKLKITEKMQKTEIIVEG